MKIAIIEDRIERLNQFALFDLHAKENVTIISGEAIGHLILNIVDGNMEELARYDCLAFHKSMLKTEVRDVVYGFCNSSKKALVYFSGSISASIYKDNEFPFLQINSKDFYSRNLEIFIENFEQSSEVNLLILQFGNRWKLALLLSLRNFISVAQGNKNLESSDSSVKLLPSEKIKRIRDLQINSLIRNDLLEVNETVSAILSSNDSSSISNEQLHEIKLAINALILSVL